MEGTFIDFMNSVAPGLGIALSVIVVCGGFILKAYKTLKKQIAEHDAEILQRANESRDNTEFKDEMLELAKSVRDMSANFNSAITDINTKMSEFKELSEEKDRAIITRMTKYEEKQEQINTKIDVVHSNMNLLIESDKESIRSFITLQYYDSQAKGYIEVYVLQALEDRYQKYLQENGDSFIANLMVEMRAMPHNPSSNT